MAQAEFLDDPMPDVIEQWRYYLSVLQIEQGDQIIDVGCGFGDAERLMLREYPNIGKVTGVDYKKERYERALSKWLEDGSPHQIEFGQGDARALTCPNDYFDRALCVDTLEWVEPPLKAVQEIRRVLKPGGCALIIHSDFDTQVFNAKDKLLSRKIVNAFADAGPNGQIGRELHGLCKEAGFHSIESMIYPLVNTSWKPNLYGYKAAHMVVDWLTSKSLMAQDELDSWIADLESQESSGSYFYSINRNISRCVK